MNSDLFNFCMETWNIEGRILDLRPHGSVAEWLGKGLQNLLQQFESARNLRIAKAIYRFGDLFFPTTNLRDKLT